MSDKALRRQAATAYIESICKTYGGALTNFYCHAQLFLWQCASTYYVPNEYENSYIPDFDYDALDRLLVGNFEINCPSLVSSYSRSQCVGFSCDGLDFWAYCCQGMYD